MSPSPPILLAGAFCQHYHSSSANLNAVVSTAARLHKRAICGDHHHGVLAGATKQDLMLGLVDNPIAFR